MTSISDTIYSLILSVSQVCPLFLLCKMMSSVVQCDICLLSHHEKKYVPKSYYHVLPCIITKVLP